MTSYSGSSGPSSAVLKPCDPIARTGVCSQYRWPVWNYVAPLRGIQDFAAAFAVLAAVLSRLPRTEVVSFDGSYLHAVARSPKGYIDDVEFLAVPARRVIHLRSAARSGVFDFGVNRRRIRRVKRMFRAERARRGNH